MDKSDFIDLHHTAVTSYLRTRSFDSYVSCKLAADGKESVELARTYDNPLYAIYLIGLRSLLPTQNPSTRGLSQI
jgi:hypothetical protein